MIYFFIFIFLFVFSFAVYSRKLNNPYTLTFIFGKKGSGKSTLMVKMMLYDIKHGWHVYTDMKDVFISGVHYFNTNDLAKFSPVEHSSVYLDEVGLSMDNRNFTKFPEGMRDFFALQRKYKCKVVVNSQSYDVDKKVRDRVDKMILQTNIGNIIGISRPIKRTVTLTDANSTSESRIADQLKFSGIFTWKLSWLPRYHKWFNSFNAPSREDLPCKVIVGKEPSRKLLKDLSRRWNKRR